MAKVIKNDLSFNSNTINYDFSNINNPITVITGDSGIGKSRYFDLMDSEQRVNKKDAYVFINHRTPKIVLEQLKKRQIHNKVVFIDNADILMKNNTETKNMLKDSDNQFIIFGRNIAAYDQSRKGWAILRKLNNKNYKMQYVIDKSRGILI